MPEMLLGAHLFPRRRPSPSQFLDSEVRKDRPGHLLLGAPHKTRLVGAGPDQPYSRHMRRTRSNGKILVSGSFPALVCLRPECLLCLPLGAFDLGLRLEWGPSSRPPSVLAPLPLMTHVSDLLEVTSYLSGIDYTRSCRSRQRQGLYRWDRI